MIKLQKDEGGSLRRATRGDKLILYVDFSGEEGQVHNTEVEVSPTELLTLDEKKLGKILKAKVDGERERLLFEPADEHLQQFKDVDFEEGE